MTDGPFRNSELSAKWRRYGEDLVSDAASLDERVRQANDSMMHDIELPEFSPLFRELKAYVERPQLDLDLPSAIETVFEQHQPSPLADNLRRHLLANIQDEIAPEAAFNQAISSSVKDLVGITKNRLDEECIRARDLGDMSASSYSKAIERNHEAFAAIKPHELSEAIASGNKRAFALSPSKRTGVDEGPEE